MLRPAAAATSIAVQYTALQVELLTCAALQPIEPKYNVCMLNVNVCTSYVFGLFLRLFYLSLSMHVPMSKSDPLLHDLKSVSNSASSPLRGQRGTVLLFPLTLPPRPPPHPPPPIAPGSVPPFPEGPSFIAESTCRNTISVELLRFFRSDAASSLHSVENIHSQKRDAFSALQPWSRWGRYRRTRRRSKSLHGPSGQSLGGRRGQRARRTS